MIVNRFDNEEALIVSGTPIKSFWGSFQVNRNQLPEVEYSHSAFSEGIFEDPDGFIDLVNTTTYPTGAQVLPDALSSSMLRTILANRRIVDVTNPNILKFFKIRFKFEHSGNDTSVIDLFTDSDLISLRCGSYLGSIHILGTYYSIPNYSSFIKSLNPVIESHDLTFTLESKLVNYPVVGLLAAVDITATLECSGHKFNVTKRASIYYSKRWQAESRLETLQ